MSTINTKVAEGGRIVIPAEYRKKLGIEVGDAVAVSLVDNEVRIMARSEAIKRAKALVRKCVPQGRSLVTELREGRRREAAKDE